MSLIRKIVHRIRRSLIKTEIHSINTPIFQGRLLEGKTALIVGGSGGIGSAIAQAFLSNGCQVVITGSNQGRLDAAYEKIGDEVQGIVLDLNNISSILIKVNAASEKLSGHIDILVNAAGVHGPADFWAITEQDYDSVMDLNVKAMFFCCQAVGKHMIENNIKGHILNISSASALKPGKTPYEISKNAVKSMTLGLATEMIKYGIVVNCLGPGPTATKMLGHGSDDDLTWNGNPAGRMATAEEMANWAVFLASDMGNYIVGDSLYVSGGSGTICIDK